MSRARSSPSEVHSHFELAIATRLPNTAIVCKGSSSSSEKKTDSEDTHYQLYLRKLSLPRGKKTTNYSCIEIHKLNPAMASSIQILLSENLNYTVWTSTEVHELISSTSRKTQEVNQRSQEKKRNLRVEGGKHYPGDPYVSYTHPLQSSLMLQLFSAWKKTSSS